MSEFVRNILLEKKITVTYRNKSTDEVLEEFILLRNELNAVGNNFNQAVRKINSVQGMPDAQLWQNMLTVLRDELQPSIKKIKERLDEYSDVWSQSIG